MTLPWAVAPDMTILAHAQDKLHLICQVHAEFRDCEPLSSSSCPEAQPEEPLGSRQHPHIDVSWSLVEGAAPSMQSFADHATFSVEKSGAHLVSIPYALSAPMTYRAA